MKREEGFTFIEAAIGLAVLAIISVAFLGGLGSASLGLKIADERETAKNLAEGQVEYVKEQAYDNTNNPPQYLKLTTGEIPDGYDIKTPMASRIDRDGDPSTDDGIQKITVTVKHGSKEILTLEDYKVN